MKVLMLPRLSNFDSEESGIKRVCEAYHRYSKDHGIEFIDCNVEDESLYDLFAVHAGTTNRFPKKRPVCAILHGLYFTADYDAGSWEWKTNANVIESIRRATVITVPSRWVAETIARDVRVYPHIIPHGIVWQEWEHSYEHEGYALWNKNRNFDVCSPEPVRELAVRFPSINFLCTFTPIDSPKNVINIGLQPHSTMKKTIQKAAVYLSTTKETFGIGVLEAMASGVPVLGFSHGGNLETIKHGITGYLARPNDYDDLASGLDYCLKNREVLSANSILLSKSWSWDSSMSKLAIAFEHALYIWKEGQRPLNVAPESYMRTKESANVEISS